MNFIFIRKDKVNGKFSPLLPNQAFKEPFLRNKWSGTDTLNQWEEIKHLKYTQVWIKIIFFYVNQLKI